MKNREANPTHNQVRGLLKDKDGNVLSQYRYTCYGQVLNPSYSTVLTDPNVQAFSFYFPDKLLSSKHTDRFIEIMSSLGLFRNATYQFLDTSPVSWESDIGKLRVFEYTVDVDVCTAQEMFFIGQVVRIMNTHPHIITDFLALLELEPDLDPFVAFCLAHCITVKFDGIEEFAGSSLIPPYSAMLTGITIKDIQDLIDGDKDYKPVRESLTYAFKGYLETKIYKQPLIQRGQRADKLAYHRHCFKHDTKYSKELVATYFDEEAYRKAFDLSYKPVQETV